MKNIKLIILILSVQLASCSHDKIKSSKDALLFDHNLIVSQAFYSNLDAINKSENDIFKKIENKKLKIEILDLINNIERIDLSEANCSSGQLACTFPNSAHTIFLTNSVLKLSEVEQFTTLLHEAFHLKQNSFEHIKCTHFPEWGYQCDQNVNSAYGIELKYLQARLKITQDADTLEFIQHIFYRINQN
jgi:hypothetical protein